MLIISDEVWRNLSDLMRVSKLMAKTVHIAAVYVMDGAIAAVNTAALIAQN